MFDRKTRDRTLSPAQEAAPRKRQMWVLSLLLKRYNRGARPSVAFLSDRQPICVLSNSDYAAVAYCQRVHEISASNDEHCGFRRETSLDIRSTWYFVLIALQKCRGSETFGYDKGISIYHFIHLLLKLFLLSA
ncbi:MAG: hypothetical protein CMO44_10575 [Verrucomicrobiales bacterium]|nr:hypothetical protein [Verrucomicrobiales bacterium]